VRVADIQGNEGVVRCREDRVSALTCCCSLLTCFRGVLDSALGFNAPDFLPHKAASFLAQYTAALLVQDALPEKALPRLLSDHRELGKHTDIVLVNIGDSARRFATRFVYNNPPFSPFGICTPLLGQCKACGALQSVKRPSIFHHAPGANSKLLGITLKCLACNVGVKFTEPRPNGKTLTRPPNVVGWLTQTLVLPNKEVPNTEDLTLGC
jgi:hypothetical protein